MEFDDHEEQEEEIGIPVSGSYENSSRVPKMTSTVDLGGGGGGVSTRKTTCRYRECLKNHAVGIGGHAVDGCGEFMAAGEEGTLDALKCAACNCHRNFHRKEIEGEGFHHNFSTSPFSYRTPGGGGGGGYIHVAPHNHHHHHQHHRPLALPSASGGGGGGNSRDDQDEDVSNPTSSGSRKRFRTKFTQEQKDKMLAFAERLGWRIQKHDEAAVQQFCTETCVKRHVLKVWMHNNKHTLEQKQKQQQQQAGECGGDEWGMGN